MNKEYLDYDGLKRYNENLMEIINRLASGPMPIYWDSMPLPEGYHASKCTFAHAYFESDGIFATTREEKLYKTENGNIWTEVTTLKNTQGYFWQKVFNCNGHPFVYGIETNNYTYAIVRNTASTWEFFNFGDFDPDPYTMVYGAGKYFIYAEDTRILYSEDGTSWMTTENRIFDNVNFTTGGRFNVTYGSSGFIAFCKESFKVPIFAYSADGLTWETFSPNIQFSKNDELYNIRYLKNKYYLCNSNGLLASEDGRIWVYVINDDIGDVFSDIYNITYGNGKWVIRAYNGFAYSLNDQKTWYGVPIEKHISDYNTFFEYVNGAFLYADYGYVMRTLG